MLIPPLPLLNFFVAVVMLSIGLRVRGGELIDILRNRALFTRTLLANCALVPALGFLLVHIFPLAPDARIGILLLATSIALYIALPLCAGLWAARRAPKIAPRLVLPLGVLATITFIFLMWETRLVRRGAFNAIRGGGSILAMLLLLLLSMVIGWLIGGPDRESRS